MSGTAFVLFLAVMIIDKNPNFETAEAPMTILVTGVKEQGLKLMESPCIAVAGEAYTPVFLLTNRGNVANDCCIGFEQLCEGERNISQEASV